MEEKDFFLRGPAPLTARLSLSLSLHTHTHTHTHARTQSHGPYPGKLDSMTVVIFY